MIAERMDGFATAISAESASMGPRSIDRGKRFEKLITEVVSRASMGPRSIDRGKALSGLRGKLCKSLQWGRDRSIAERTKGKLREAMEARLQWGRDRSIAERTERARIRVLGIAASMGPRSIDRGKVMTWLSVAG